MKKTKKVLSSLLFFLCACVCVFNFFRINFRDSCFAKAKSGEFFSNQRVSKDNKFEYNIICDGKQFYFLEDDFNLKNLSPYQKQMRESKEISKWLSKLQNLGLTKKESIEYIFPETKDMLKKIKNATEFLPQSEQLFVVQNECKLEFENGEAGKFVDEISFYKNFEESLQRGSLKINVKCETKPYDFQKLERKEFLEKSCFSTNFETSSEARKNNIKVALSSFDGFVLEDGEILSFNSVTGVRNEKAGYKPAKIISGGTFTEGFGGGVCQVSTTLYNACLLAGLEILEVHNHSLPVSYIEPSFDAMVNIGSSDLVVRNNSGGRLIFTTSSKGDTCKVKIFGKPNQFKITRFSEKTKVLPAEKEELVTDPEKVLEYGLQVGEERRISYAKDGFCSNGYLNYYDKQGNLIKTKKIRSNTYNPTRGVVVKNVG